MHQHNKINEKIYSRTDRLCLIITEPKTFHFDLPKNVDENLKHENDFILKYNKFSTEHTIKSEISRLLSKYKYGNDIYEQRKQ